MRWFVAPALFLLACRPTSPSTPPATAPSPAAKPASAGSETPEGRQPDDLGPLLAQLRKKAKIPSLAAAVVDADGLAAIGVDGLRRIDEEGATTVDDKFHLGSNTKAMTATVVARLVDRGDIGWDLTLGEVFGKDAVHKDYRPVTLTQLLQHRAGVPADSLAFEELTKLDAAKGTDEHRTIVAATVLAAKPLHKPGTEHLYSNLGYVLVGAVLERVTGTPWETLMRDELFEPLGMSSCGFGPPAMGDTRDQPWAHLAGEGNYLPVEADNPPYYGPAGTVHCSLEDYGKFAAAHFAGAEHVSPASLAKLHEAIPNADTGGGYAMGWGVPQTRAIDSPVFAHDGSNSLNYASILLLPEKRIAIVAACNAGNPAAQKAIVETVMALFGRYVLK